VSAGPATFKETDVGRVLKAAKKAGVRVRIDIEKGHLRVTMIADDEPDSTTDNPWDEVLK
jgi:hypothetical protein